MPKQNYAEEQFNRPVVLTHDSLRVHFRTGRSYVISGTGRDRKMGYRKGVMCQLGDIEQDQWCKLVSELIEQCEEQTLYEHLYQFLKENNHCWKSAAELKMEAMELYAARIFDDPEWVLYVRFNQTYRPDVLNHTNLIRIKPMCCNVPGITTEALVKRGAPSGRYFCPHCLRQCEAVVVGPANQFIEKSLTISQDELDKYHRLMTEETVDYEQNTIARYATVVCWTISLGGGFEADLEVCSGRDGDPLWCQAVLFLNGCEISCSEVEDDLSGDWELTYTMGDCSYWFVLHVLGDEN